MELTDNNLIQDIFATEPELELNFLTVEGEIKRETPTFQEEFEDREY